MTQYVVPALSLYAYNPIALRELLNFLKGWVGGEVPIPMPPKSPDLTLIRFLCQSYMKIFVYDVATVPNFQDLRQWLINAEEQIEKNLNKYCEFRKIIRICIGNFTLRAFIYKYPEVMQT